MSGDPLRERERLAMPVRPSNGGANPPAHSYHGDASMQGLVVVMGYAMLVAVAALAWWAW
jgi:hypothetical protein